MTVFIKNVSLSLLIINSKQRQYGSYFNYALGLLGSYSKRSKISYKYLVSL